ncbi:MAG: hypothetical protein OXN97_19475 [Bryobacterales bacterium]|nr:hypothetical protein [Bryobacterales bacterium]
MKTVFLLVKFFNNPRYADGFVRGQVFARTLADFKSDENSDESGRVDPDEGTIAWYQPGKGRLTINGMDVTDDLAGPVKVQKDWLNHLNVFCVHACHSGDLDLSSLSSDTIEDLRQELTIDKRCFNLGNHAVVVRDVPEFVNRMESSARAKGYRIGRKLVRYYDPATFHGEFADIESVFRKQDQFSYQREFRFVIDRGTLEQEPLVMNVGDLSDITLQLKSTELNGEKLIGGKGRLVQEPVNRS